MKQSIILLVTLFFITTATAQTLYPSTFFVKETARGEGNGRSWDNASSNLDSIIKEAKVYDVILVAEGTYEGNFIMKEGVNVLGGFPKEISDTTRDSERKFPGNGENLTIIKPVYNGGRSLSQYTKFKIPTIWEGFIMEGGNLHKKNFGSYYPDNNIITGKDGEAIGVLFEYSQNTGKGKMISKDSRFYPNCKWGVDDNIPSLNDISDNNTAHNDLDGKSNTQKILDYHNTNTTFRGTPAHICDTFSLGGYDDWYLPSSGEFYKIFNESYRINESMDLIGGDKLIKSNPEEKGLYMYYTSTEVDVENIWISSNSSLKKFDKVWALKTLPGRLFDIDVDYKESTNFSGGGVHLLEGGIVRNCIIRNNNAKIGGGAYLGEGAKMEGCLVLDNWAEDGMGAGIYSVKGVILNVTAINNYTGNPTPQNSSSVFSDGGIVANSIIHNSPSHDINFSDFRHINGCIIASVATPNGTTVVDEYDFVNYYAKDFNLAPNSTLINSGQKDYLSSDFNFSINNRLVVPDSLDLGVFQTKKKAVYINNFEIQGKTYDGTDDVHNWGYYPQLCGVEQGDELYINYNSCKFDSPDAGRNKKVILDFILGGYNKDDYAYVAIEHTADIYKKKLDIKADTASMIFGTNTATLNLTNYTASGFVNGETKAVITTPPTITLSGVTSTSASGVYPNSLTPTNAVAKNYDIEYTQNSFTVKPKHLTLENLPNKTYGDTIFEIKASHNLNKEFIVKSKNPNIIEVSKVDGKWQGKIKGTGLVKLEANFTGDVQTIEETAFQEIRVDKGSIMMRPDSIIMAFGTDPSTLDLSNKYTITGFVYDEGIHIMSPNPSVQISSSITSNTPVGLYMGAAWVSYPNYPNYNLGWGSNYVRIVPNHDLVIFDTVPNKKTYGDTAFIITGRHITGKQIYFESDNTSVIDVAKIGADWKATIKGTGTVNLKAKFDGDMQNPGEHVSRSITVSKAPLTITADSLSMQYGTNPTSISLTDAYTIKGLVYSETTAVLGTPPTVSLDPFITSTTIVGTHLNKVLVSGATADNYAITHVSNKFKIEKNSSANITFDSVPDKTYGDAVFTLTASHELGKAISIESDNTGVISVAKLGTEWKATIKGTGTVNLKAKFDGDTEVSAKEKIQNITINKAPLTITADSAIMLQGTNPATINLTGKYTITGFVYSETNAVFTTQPVVSIDNSITSSTAVGVYADKVLVNGTTASNYAITHKSNKLRVKLNSGDITFDIIGNKTYGDPVFTLTGSHAKNKQIYFVSDNTNIINVAKTGTEWKATIKGTGTVNLKAKFDGDSEASAEEKIQSITISKAALSIKADTVNMVYGTNPATINLANKYTATGFVYNETTSALSTLPTVSILSAITPATNAGLYSGNVQVSGATSNNYNISYTHADLTITKAAQKIEFPNPGTVLVGAPDFNSNITVNSSLPLTYTSSNTSVAEISANGKISVRGIGTTTITATQAGNNNHISVTESKDLQVVEDLGTLGISINGEDLTITKNMYYDMGASLVSNLNIEINLPIGSTVEPGNSFVVEVEKPMIKTVELVVTDSRGNKEEYTITIEKRFAFHKIVVTRWNNTLTVIKNSEITSGYNLETYKWFRNGEEIATGQSYYTGSKNIPLDPNDNYMVEVTSPDFEGVLRTNEGNAIIVRSQDIRAYPNPVNRNEMVYVDADVDEELLEGAVIKIYNYTGMYIDKVDVKGRLTPINLPDASLYIFKLSGKNGLSKELRVIVK